MANLLLVTYFTTFLFDPQLEYKFFHKTSRCRFLPISADMMSCYLKPRFEKAKISDEGPRSNHAFSKDCDAYSLQAKYS